MSRRAPSRPGRPATPPRFLALRVRHDATLHGYDARQQEVVTAAGPGPFVDKLVAIDRIRSVSAEHLLVTGPEGRLLYWAYEGGFEALLQRLRSPGLLLG